MSWHASHPAHLLCISVFSWWRLSTPKRELCRAGCLHSLLPERELGRAGCLRSLLPKWEACRGLGCCAGSKAWLSAGLGLLPKAEAAGRLPRRAKHLAATGLLRYATKPALLRLLLGLRGSERKPAAGRLLLRLLLGLRGSEGKPAAGRLLLSLLLWLRGS